ncbi:MAG: nitroreductase family protein [Desulfobacterales bacterium]|nr:nitroreductase family protein [Desulfobacterales bacterium]
MLISLLQKRRSIRKFQDKKVEPEKIETLIEAALRSPSGGAKNPWEFVVVTDKEILEKLSTAKEHGSALIKGASLGIVICADPGKQDIWIEDAAIASTIIHLTAASLELGSCWIQIRERMHKGNEPAESYITELLGLPKNLKVLSMVAIGYPAEEKPGHGKEELLYDRIHRNRYGKK